MRTPRSSWSLLSLSLLAAAPPVAAQDSRSPPPPVQRERASALQLEALGPGLDGSHAGVRLLLLPTRTSPLALGVMARTSGWNSGPSSDLRLRTPGQDPDVKENFGIGVEGRYAVASLSRGAFEPFVALSVGVEEFSARAEGALERRDANIFLEPAAGLLWRPHARRMGLTLRAGPGVTLADDRTRAVGGTQLELRRVYPAVSLGIALRL